MNRVQSPRVATQSEADQQMLDWLRSQFAKFSEGGYGGRYADTVIARFAELIENQTTFKRGLASIEDAHKLAMTQVQFAQSVIRQMERQVDSLIEHKPDRPDSSNGNKGKSTPAIDLKGK